MLLKVKIMVSWNVLCAINACSHFYEQAKMAPDFLYIHLHSLPQIDTSFFWIFEMFFMLKFEFWT